MGIILAILMFSFIVFFHELGHFTLAKKNGIDVEEALIQRYVGLNREEAENLALEVSVKIAKEIADSADGFYVITPFNRVSLVSRIVEAIRDGHVIS